MIGHWNTMSHAGTTIRRFIEIEGGVRYSIRERSDGMFQIVQDGGKLEDGSQPYWMEDRILTGIYATADLAEDEVQRFTRGTCRRD
jgi:hypothetical protein